MYRVRSMSIQRTRMQDDDLGNEVGMPRRLKLNMRTVVLFASGLCLCLCPCSSSVVY